MDPASLVLGILPVLGSTIKACKLTRKKFKIFQHYSRELRRLQKQVDRQWHFFTNEVHLLLRPIVDNEFIVEDMLSDRSHHQWTSKRLEGGIRESLGTNYEACRDVIEEVGAIIESMHGLFQCFDELASHCEMGESLKEAARRLRTRIKVVYDQSKFEQGIVDLRAANNDLQRLREQAFALEKSKSVVESASQRRQRSLQQEYDHLSTIREAARAFHAALIVAWSNSPDASTTDALKHRVRLLIDAQVRGHVCMNVFISCFGHGFSSSLHEQSIALEVQSQRQDEADAPVSPDDAPRKRRRVRFLPQAPHESLESPLIHCSGQDMTDLCSKGLCSVLYTAGGYSKESMSNAPCLGYIRNVSDHGFRHLIYGNVSEEPKKTSALCSPAHLDVKPMTINDIMNIPAEKSITIVEQLELARDFVSTMLKFYSTPWLRQYVSLGDLSFFPVDKDLPASLRTLHIGLDFVQRSNEGNRLISEVDDDPTTAIEHARLQYGVRNLTLWSLGTILLQIGRWSRVEAPDDVALVRRLSSEIPSLGPRYRDLTKRCLECDFGFGDDLSRPRLQQAVYEGLVGELNDMIGGLKISE